MIEFQDVEKSYGDIRAVQGVSLLIERGEAFGLLGPNGAGKSTMIGMMVGHLHPDEGSVQINGGDPRSAVVRATLGFAPQSLSLYDELTARENLRFFCQMYRLPRSQTKDRVNWGIEFAALEDRRRDRVKTFSGGMKRRLNLACALVHAPEVVFLDEPTVGVDPQSRNHIFDCIEQLKTEKLTIVYTTHYMEEAERLCDRVAIVDHGKVLADGPVAQLIDAHAGQSQVRATIGGEWPDGIAKPSELDGNVLEFADADPLMEITRLATSGVQFDSLHVDRANLETVFLNLTGRKLRD